MPSLKPIRELADHPNYDLEQLTEHYHRQLDRQAERFLEERGIEEQTAEEFRIGFESGRFGFYIRENGLSDYFEDRLIVPLVSPEGVIVDLVGRALDNRDPLYKSLYGVEDFLFNEKALMDSEEVVLVSDMLDALTLIQAELPAVCLPNSLIFKESHAERFAGKRVFLCLSNDEAGRRESVRIEAILKEKASEIYRLRLPEKVRTVNELFVRKEHPLEEFRAILQEAVDDAIKASIASDHKYLTVFREEYDKRRSEPEGKARTGIAGLDQILGGGLARGLYLLRGGMNSGKSTLMKQMADGMSAAGHPVVYVSWDLTPFELWAKSVSRVLGVPAWEVLEGEIEPDRIEEANQSIDRISKLQWTLEASLGTELADICEYVEKIALQAGKPPIVFMDPFQRLVYAALRKGEVRQPAHYVLYQLKEWSREWNAVIMTAVSESVQDAPMREVIGQTADGILAIEHGKPEEGGQTRTSIRVEKNRRGHRGRASVLFCREKAAFFDISAPSRPTGNGEE
ncbi:DnaB-like helicase C-terminal domain-containing protein [Gorillibacterium sp. sgz500922]|uniref:DnaB-like helicase C-terminal domain-containing protein n=1 Tax=Gorillibacterium sp. sgz500922 TaxID=3446694 RepID=UPI003F66A884